MVSTGSRVESADLVLEGDGIRVSLRGKLLQCPETPLFADRLYQNCEKRQPLID